MTNSHKSKLEAEAEWLTLEEQDEAILTERRRQFDLGIFIGHDEMKSRVQAMLAG